jgi:polysaccharide transporter, PST family
MRSEMTSSPSGLVTQVFQDVQSHPAGARLSRNLVSYAGGALLGKLLVLLTFTYAARVLGPENYGGVSFAISITAYASILLSPGLMTWGTRAIARDPGRAGEILIIVNATQLVLAVVGYMALAGFALFFVDGFLERGLVLASGLALFASALSVDWVFQGLESMWIPAALSVGAGAANLLALFALVQAPADALRYPLIAFVSSMISIGAGYVLLRRRSIQLTWPCLRDLWRALHDSIPLGATFVLVVLVNQANVLIVHTWLGASALGLFAAPLRVVEATSALPGILAAVFRPRLARLAAIGPADASREAHLFAQAHMVIGLLLAAVLTVEAPLVLTTLFGAKYASAAGLLRLMSVGIIFNYALCGYTNCLIPFGRDRAMLAVLVVTGVVAIGGGLVLVPRFGLVGAALAMACFNLAGWLASIPSYRRTIGPLQLYRWLSPVLCGVGIVAAAGILHYFHIPALGRLGTFMAISIPFLIYEGKKILRLNSVRLGVG